MPDDERFEARKPLCREEARKILAQVDEDAWMDSAEAMYMCACVIAAMLRMADPDQISHAIMDVDRWVLEELARMQAEPSAGR